MDCRGRRLEALIGFQIGIEGGVVVCVVGTGGESWRVGQVDMFAMFW